MAEATISRLMQDNEFLKREVKFNIEAVESLGEDFSKKLEDLMGFSELQSKLNSISNSRNSIEIEVVYPMVSEDKYHDEFARLGAPILGAWLNERGNRVGVSWGKEIKKFIKPTTRYIKTRSTKQKNPLEFIPLCGILSRNDQASLYSSTNHSLSFNAQVNNSTTKIHNLNCVPMRYPKKYAEDEEHYDVLQKFLYMAFPDYTEIFRTQTDDKRGALINNIDTIITSVGGATRNQFPHLEESSLFPVSGMARGKKNLRWGEGNKSKRVTRAVVIKEIICGDISGILLPREYGDNHTKNSQVKAVVDALNHRLTTLRAEHLESCAERSLTDGNNGVIVIALGQNKAEAIHSAIKHGYISKLIVDTSLADALVERASRSD